MKYHIWITPVQILIFQSNAPTRQCAMEVQLGTKAIATLAKDIMDIAGIAAMLQMDVKVWQRGQDRVNAKVFATVSVNQSIRSQFHLN